MKASEFDEKFASCNGVSDQVDWCQSTPAQHRRPRGGVDFPSCVVSGLEKQAQRLRDT